MVVTGSSHYIYRGFYRRDFDSCRGTFPNNLVQYLQSLSSNIKPYSLTTVWFIFSKNVFSLILSFIFSPFLLLAPLFTLVINSWMIGFVSASITETISLNFLIKGILPHGIFEIPAMLIGEAASLFIGSYLILALFLPARRNHLVPQIKRSSSYLLIAVLLLIPSAFIETYLTPLLLVNNGIEP